MSIAPLTPNTPTSLTTLPSLPIPQDLSEEDKIFLTLHQPGSQAYKIFESINEQVKKEFQPLDELAQKSLTKIQGPSQHFSRQVLEVMNIAWKVLSLYKDFSVMVNFIKQPIVPTWIQQGISSGMGLLLWGVNDCQGSDRVFNAVLQSTNFRLFCITKTALEIVYDPLFVRSHLLATKKLPCAYAPVVSVARIAAQFFFNSFFFSPLGNTVVWQLSANWLSSFFLAGGKCLQEMHIRNLYLQTFEKHLKKALNSPEHQDPAHQRILQVIKKVNREKYFLATAQLFFKHI